MCRFRQVFPLHQNYSRRFRNSRYRPAARRRADCQPAPRRWRSGRRRPDDTNTKRRRLNACATHRHWSDRRGLAKGANPGRTTCAC
jgi:hypothetical protein